MMKEVKAAEQLPVKAATAGTFHTSRQGSNGGTEGRSQLTQPGRGCCGDEELAAIGAWPGICHGQHAWLRVLQRKVLVGKSGACNRVCMEVSVGLGQTPPHT
jgi:hypothetical protein